MSSTDSSFVRSATDVLRLNGFRVTVGRDGAETLELFRSVGPDLVLLDVALSKVSGIEVCRTIRADSGVPIIFVSDRSSEIDVVVALEIGADDYLAKPQRLQELVARARAVLRRVPTTLVEPEEPVIEIGEVRLDPDRHELFLAGRPVALARKEFQLLKALLERPGTVLTRRTLIDRVWGADYVGDTKTLDVHVRRLRAKIEREHSLRRSIVTIRGVGFKFESEGP
ncbi:MAG: winged helix-turn-helix domain-containing protein [Acidimicrobiales bacterium]